MLIYFHEWSVHMPKLSDRVQTFTDSVIRRMTRISDEHGAINLSQGFPDFDPPKPILDALAKVAYEGPHQYSVTYGARNLRRTIQRDLEDPISEKIIDSFEIPISGIHISIEENGRTGTKPVPETKKFYVDTDRMNQYQIS